MNKKYLGIAGTTRFLPLTLQQHLSRKPYELL